MRLGSPRRRSPRRRLTGAAVVLAGVLAVSSVGAGTASAGGSAGGGPPGGGGDECARVRPGPPRGVNATAAGYEGHVTWGRPLDIILGRTCGPVTGYKVAVKWGESNCNVYEEPDRTIRELRFGGNVNSTDYFVDDWTAGWYSFAVTAETAAGPGARSGWTTPICLGRR